MKSYTERLFFLPALLMCLGLIPAGRATAQTFTTLHSFTAKTDFLFGTNSDGAYPYGGLITNASGNTLYGTASRGGSSGQGTVFAVNTDGAGFTNLHSFTGPDGANPYAGLVLSGNTLFGTAVGGGGFGAGTVFSVNTSGTGFTILRTFEPIHYNRSYECASSYDCVFITGSECAQCVLGPQAIFVCYIPYGICPGETRGGYPYAGLILSGDTLYGTARGGPYPDQGTVFGVSTNGGGYWLLHGFGSGTLTGPKAGLILSGDALYGTTASTVFAVNYNGDDFRVVHGFTGNDGSGVQAGLVLSGNTLYGTASQGGSSGQGTVFAVNTNGSGFTNLHSFTGDSDGANPYAGLILSGNTLYGTAAGGGRSGAGTVFALHTDGTGFTNLHSFSALLSDMNSDGAFPWAKLTLSGNTLYGTASAGGSSGNGTVFSLSFQPHLAITASGPNAILSWPTNVAGFDYTGYTLQSTTNLDSSALWTTHSSVPVFLNGQNTVTNRISGTQQFFRLIQ